MPKKSNLTKEIPLLKMTAVPFYVDTKKQHKNNKNNNNNISKTTEQQLIPSRVPKKKVIRVADTARHPNLIVLKNKRAGTTEHLLLYCPNLQLKRKELLPTNPTIHSTLYGQLDQLKKTSTFIRLALTVQE